MQAWLPTFVTPQLITSVIVMPHGTPFNKIKRTQDFGATVELHGKTFEEAMEATREMMARDGLVLIHPFDDPIVVAGQGTVACEILEQEPDLDVIVVPIGGGGLIAGIATAAKAIKPDVQVIGAQAELFDAVKSAIDGTAPHFNGASLAEGIAVKAPSPANVEVIRRRVDRIESVTEEQIEAAVTDLQCDGLDADEAALIQHYAGDEVSLARIERVRGTD